MLKYMWGVALLVLLSLSFQLPQASAQVVSSPSPGCNSANAGTFDFSTFSTVPVSQPFSGTFAQGEKLTFEVLVFGASGPFVQATATDTTAGVTILNVFNGSAPISQDYTIPASGNRNFNLVLESETGEGSFETEIQVRCMAAPPGSITIRKTTVGGDGTFNYIGGLGAFSITTVGGSGQQLFANIVAGSYVVRETITTGFTLTTIVCTGDSDNGSVINVNLRRVTIDLDPGENIICTFTNVAQSSLIIQKVTIGGDGSFDFSGGLGAFNITTSGGSGQQSFPNTAAGSYAVIEAVSASFTLTSISCSGDTDNGSIVNLGSRQVTIDLDAGENIICTFTNTILESSVIIRKISTGGDSTFNFSGGLGSFDIATSSGSGEQSFANVAAGSYVVTEGPAATFTLMSIVCSGDTDNGSVVNIASRQVTIDVDPGENITCTYTNAIIQGSIIIQKMTVGGDATFNFSGDLGAFAIDTSGGSGQQVFSNLSAGSFVVTEAVVSAFTLTSIVCTGDTDNGSVINLSGRQATIDLDPGENITCIYTNTAVESSIIIRKVAVGGNGTFNYTGDLGPFSIGTAGGSGQQTFASVAAGSYTVTETAAATFNLTSLSCSGDSDNGSIVNLTSRQVTIDLDVGENIICTFTNTMQQVQLGTVTIIKIADGGNGTFTFSSPQAELDAISLTTASGRAQSNAVSLAAGTYTITEDILAVWNLTDLQCFDPDGGSSVNINTRTATIDLDDGEAIECTFTNTFTDTPERTRRIIKNFLNRRIGMLLSEELDRNRYLRRIPGALWGETNGNGNDTGAPASFAFQPSKGTIRGRFAASLSQIMAYQQQVEMARLKKLGMKLGLNGSAETKPQTPRRGWDFWIEGHYNHFKDDNGGADRKGHFGIIYAGLDYLVDPAILVGLLAQYDTTTDKSGTLGSDVRGHGWMVGPYVSARLTPNLLFDARAAWGQSDNKIKPFGTYTDNFDTNRWLVRANLTGNWHSGNWRFTPSASIAYISERQKTYTDSLGLKISGQTVSLGRFTFGPEIAYRIKTEDGTIFEPHASISGIWDFHRPGDLSVGGLAVSADEFRASVEAGLLVYGGDGLSVRAVGKYDGIGDKDFQSYGGQLWLNFPLN